MPLWDMAESKLLFRAHITPKRGRLLVTVASPLMPKPLYRSYPGDMPQDAAVERAVGHAANRLTGGQPAQVRVTWQGVLGWAKYPVSVQSEECQKDARKALQR